MWHAFGALSGDRALGDAGRIGQIPFLAVDRYAARFGPHDADEFERFFTLLRRMDAAYIEWAAAKMKPQP